jgi:hypothetical protein
MKFLKNAFTFLFMLGFMQGAESAATAEDSYKSQIKHCLQKLEGGYVPASIKSFTDKNTPPLSPEEVVDVLTKTRGILSKDIPFNHPDYNTPGGDYAVHNIVSFLSTISREERDGFEGILKSIFEKHVVDKKTHRTTSGPETWKIDLSDDLISTCEDIFGEETCRPLTRWNFSPEDLQVWAEESKARLRATEEKN